MELVKAGADRQAMHEAIRSHSMAAWAAVAGGAPNPLPDRLSADAAVTAYLPPEQVRALLDAAGYVGDAPERARDMAKQISESTKSP
jgi:adenylosuccinate lyase